MVFLRRDGIFAPSPVVFRCPEISLSVINTTFITSLIKPNSRLEVVTITPSLVGALFIASLFLTGTSESTSISK